MDRYRGLQQTIHKSDSNRYLGVDLVIDIMAQDCNLGPNQTFYCCFTRMTLHSDTQNRLIKSKSSNITILVHTYTKL